MLIYWLLVAHLNRPAAQRRRPLRATPRGRALFLGLTAFAVLIVAWFVLRYVWVPVVLAIGG